MTSNDLLVELESWYGSERGLYLLEQLGEALKPYLENAFGYHIVQIGPVTGHTLFGDCRINHRVQAADSAQPGVDLVCLSTEIPLESDSVDVIIAHHSLEFVDNPHQVLREIERILTPHGQLLVIGFNPFSLRGAATAALGLSQRSSWSYHQPVSARRLTDWLHLLGCELENSRYLWSLPVLGKGRLRRAMAAVDGWCARHNLPIGGVYVLRAIKTVVAQNRPRSRLRRHGEKLIDLAVPKPAVAPSPAPSAPGRSVGVAARDKNGERLH